MRYAKQGMGRRNREAYAVFDAQKKPETRKPHPLALSTDESREGGAFDFQARSLRQRGVAPLLLGLRLLELRLLIFGLFRHVNRDRFREVECQQRFGW